MGETGAVAGNVPARPAYRKLDRAVLPQGVAGGASYLAVTILALLVRIVTLNQYVGHLDEPASLLAVDRVAKIGYPIYPSGVLYLQGAVFSYLAAPLAWVYSESSLFHAARLLYLVLALALVPLSMKLVKSLTGSIWVAIFVGILIACDPNLIVWSVTIRPYGWLAVEVIALALLFSMLLEHGPEARLPVGRVVYWLPVLAVIGTFTHIGFWLSAPALALAGLLVWKTALLSTHRAILISGVVCVVPLAVFLLVGRFVGTGSGTGEGNLGSSFVGSHLFSLDRFMTSPKVDWWIWTGNFFEGEFHELMPFLIALVSGVLIVAALTPRNEASERWRAQAIGMLVLVHWSIIFAVTLLVSSDPDPRYLNQVLAIGHILVGLAAWSLWRLAAAHLGMMRRFIQIGVVVVVFILPSLFYAATAAAWRMDYPGGSPDYWTATAWASEHRNPGEVVITALPPSAYFWFSEKEYDDLYFLAGPAEGRRAQRYIKPDANGDPGDYWLGLQSIGSVEQLCTALQEHAGNASIVVDVGRLSAPWALKGVFERVIVGSTVEQYRGANGIVVLSIVPVTSWTPEARAECSR